MIRVALLALMALSCLWPGDVPAPHEQSVAGSAVRMLREIGRLKPNATDIDRYNALFDTHREVRSILAAQLGDITPYVDAGIAASGPRSSSAMRNFWAPLVEACTIDRPQEGRPALGATLANPKLPIKARGWIISYVMVNAGDGQAIAWLPADIMWQLAKDLSQIPESFHTVRLVAITTKDIGPAVETAFTGPMLSASILQGYFSVPLPPRWDDTTTNDADVLLARTTMISRIPIALEDAAQRSAIAVSAICGFQKFWPLKFRKFWPG